jgi:hypothetical protein
MIPDAAMRPVEGAGVRIPSTPLAVAAAEAARASLSEVVVGHALRVFAFASLAARRDGEACDADALYVASMYANMGLSGAYAHYRQRYDDADAAHAVMKRHGAASGLCVDVWCAIALHMTPGLPARMSPLARVLYAAVRTDLLAENLGGYSAAQCDGILAAWPRGARFKERMIEAIGRGVAHRPSTTFGTLSADVLERVDPEYCRMNFCGLILGSSWKD